MKAYHVVLYLPIASYVRTSVPEIARLMTTHQLDTFSVVDDHMRVIRLVSKTDFFLSESVFPFSASKGWRLCGQWVELPPIADVYPRAHHYTAADVTTREPVCVDANSVAGNIALLMVQRRLGGVPVLRQARRVCYPRRSHASVG